MDTLPSAHLRHGHIMCQADVLGEAVQTTRLRLYGCGWLLIGTGDVGSQPVGVRIWSDRKCNLLVSPTKDARSDADERFTLSVGSSEVFEIQVNAGSSVSIAGHAVGVIK